MVLLAKLLRVLAIGAELSPGLLTYGFCMGLFLGFMPTGATEFSLVLAFLLIAFTRQSWGFMMATAGVVKAAMAAGLWRPVAATGRAVLEAGALQGLWANVLDWPVLRLLQLERYPAMGGLVWTLALSLVLGFPIYKSMSWMQTSLLPKLPRIPILGWMLRMLFFGVRPIAAVTGPSAEPVDVNKTIAIQPDGVDDETNDTPAALKEPLSKRPPAVRWFVFIPTVVAAIVFELVFGASLLDYITRKAASASVGVQLWLQETNLSLTRGIVGYKKIKAEQETTGEVTKDLASVEAATVNVNVAHLLKGALTVEEARVTNPEFRYVRGEEKTEAAPADPKIAEEIRKKLEDEDFMNSVLEKVQQKYDEWKKSQPAEESKTPDPSKPEPAQVAEAAPLSEADKALLGRASYMSERPLVWLQSLICDGLSLKIEDRSPRAAPSAWSTATSRSPTSRPTPASSRSPLA
jgi:hypothetical protein